MVLEAREEHGEERKPASRVRSVLLIVARTVACTFAWTVAWMIAAVLVLVAVIGEKDCPSCIGPDAWGETEDCLTCNGSGSAIDPFSAQGAANALRHFLGLDFGLGS